MPSETKSQLNAFDMVLDQIKDLKDETKGHGKMLAGTMIKLDNLSEHSKKIEKALEKVAEAEWSCPARLNDDRTQRRISKLEALKTMDQTGEISVIRQLPTSEAPSNNSSIVIKFFIKNWLQLLILVLLALIGLMRIAQDGDLPTEVLKQLQAEQKQEVGK